MCTVVLLFRPETEWKLLLAANRDEMLARPWRGPAAHWPEQPEVVGGLDELAGGTWLAVNRAGVVAAVLNRTGSLGPAEDRRSRGGLPLLALRHASADRAAGFVAALDAGAWRSFNLVIADRGSAWLVRGRGEGRPELQAFSPGLHMVTAGDADDSADPRIARHLPRFLAAAPPRPPDWGDWPGLLADREGPAGAAINIPEAQGFGTGSAWLIGLGPHEDARFAAGPPDRSAFLPVAWPTAAPGSRLSDDGGALAQGG